MVRSNESSYNIDKINMLLGTDAIEKRSNKRRLDFVIIT